MAMQAAKNAVEDVVPKSDQYIVTEATIKESVAIVHLLLNEKRKLYAQREVKANEEVSYQGLRRSAIVSIRKLEHLGMHGLELLTSFNCSYHMAGNYNELWEMINMQLFSHS